LAALVCAPVFGAGGAESARSDAPKAENAKPAAPKVDTAKAQENRKKPLQRCDQLADKAQLDCLRQARERVVEARKKREAGGAQAAGGADKAKGR
jgi:hypothetical protein